MDTVDEMRIEPAAVTPLSSAASIQGGGYLLELSPDWLVLSASENIHKLLRESHVVLINEPLGRFVQAEALHDLRNLFSRLSGTTGIARAYGIRLTDESGRVDVAFQLKGDRVLLEILPSPDTGFGHAFGTVGGLIAGLADSSGQALLDGGARRMRALTGYDRVTLTIGDRRAESSRGALLMKACELHDLPPLLGDTDDPPVGVFPREDEDSALEAALLRALDDAQLAELRAAGVRASMRVPFKLDGKEGQFRCDCGSAREPRLEIHAAAELFAQLFCARLEIDSLKG